MYLKGVILRRHSRAGVNTPLESGQLTLFELGFCTLKCSVCINLDVARSWDGSIRPFSS